MSDVGTCRLFQLIVNDWNLSQALSNSTQQSLHVLPPLTIFTKYPESCSMDLDPLDAWESFKKFFDHHWAEMMEPEVIKIS